MPPNEQGDSLLGTGKMEWETRRGGRSPYARRSQGFSTKYKKTQGEGGTSKSFHFSMADHPTGEGSKRTVRSPVKASGEEVNSSKVRGWLKERAVDKEKHGSRSLEPGLPRESETRDLNRGKSVLSTLEKTRFNEGAWHRTKA